MIDLLRIAIPIREAFVHVLRNERSGDFAAEVDIKACHRMGCKLTSGEVVISDEGTEVLQLRHPYESIPSSNSSISFKIFPGSPKYWPFAEIKASPAKLLQGHNVFGPTDPELCLMAVIDAFTFQMPELSSILDWKHASIKTIDCTFTAQMNSEVEARQVVSALRHVSAGQIRPSRQSFATTAMWNPGSRHCVRKAYLKGPELQGSIEDIQRQIKKDSSAHLRRQLAAMQKKEVQDFARCALRFEASIKERSLNRMGVPTQVVDFIEYANNEDSLIQRLWQDSFKDIFASFEGENVNIYNDEDVHNKLRSHYARETKKGFSYAKADRLFRFFRSIKHEGFDEIKRTTPEKTFYRNLGDLTEIVPRAYLQNLSSIASNVVPLVRLIDVNFSKQHPANYTTPKSMIEQLTGNVMPLKTG